MFDGVFSRKLCFTKFYRLRCRANISHVRQAKPDSGLKFQVKVLQTFSVVLFSAKRLVPESLACTCKPDLTKVILLESGPLDVVHCQDQLSAEHSHIVSTRTSQLLCGTMLLLFSSLPLTFRGKKPQPSTLNKPATFDPQS